MDKVFDADGITNITGSLKYFNKELQTTISQGYTAKKAMDAKKDGVYELKLAHERLIQTFKNEKTVNEALLKAQADAVKNQLYAQIDSSHQPRDAVITGSLKGYFDDSFIVNTKDKLDELRRAISAAKSNLSALEQVAKSGDSFNALTNQYEKFEKTPATLEKLTVAIGKLKNSNVSILGNDVDLTDNLKRLKGTYDLIEKAKSQPISNLPVDKQVDAVKNRVQAIRDYLTEIRLLSGYVGAAKAVELNDSRKEKYNVDYDKMQSNFQKAEQSFNKLTVKSPELKKRLEDVRAVVSSISDQFDGSAANASSVASALKQIQALNSRIVAERNSPVNSVANIQDNLLSWKTQLAGYQLDTNKLSDKAYASDSIAAVSELSTEYTRLKQLADEYLALASAGTEEEKRKAEELRIASERYETLNKNANTLVGLTKKNAAAELSQAVNSRNLQNLEATFRNFMSANGKVNENAGLRVMASNIDAQIETLKKAGDKLDEASIAKLRQNLSLLDSLSSELGYKGQTYEQRIQGKMQELTSYFVSVTSFGFAIQQIRNMISNVNALDDAMTELRKVTEETDATYDKFLTNAAKRAQTLGSTMSDVVIATGSFARMGYNLEEAEKLGDAAIIAQNVWDNVGSIDETSNTIISAMKAFGIAAEDAMRIVNVYNAVSNSFGVTSGNIADAMADAGAALEAAGNNFDESVALFTATNEVIQDYSKTATALRTIAARIRNTSGELAEMEIDADGAAESITQLQQKIYKASGNKVNIFEDDNETFKSTIQILRELSEVWNTLSDVDQAEITRLIAGTRQQSVFAAIMNNFDTVDKVIETSVNSTGSAVAENEKYLDSITGKLDLLKSSYEALSSSIINSDIYKGGIDLLRGVLDLLNEIASVSSGGALIGTLNSVAGAAGYGLFDLETILEAKSNGSKNWIKDGSLWGMLVGNDKADSKIMEQIADEFKAAQGSAESYGDVLQSVSSRFAALHSETRKTLEANLATKSSFSDAAEFASQYATQLGEATVKTKLLTLAGKAGNIALNAFTGFLVGAAIDGLISLGKYIFTMRQRSIDAAAEITKAWKEAEDKLEDMKSSVKSLTDSYDEFEKLSKGVSAYGENLSLTADEYDRYHEISNQIADLFPSLIVGYDSQYNAVVKLKNGVTDLNAEYEKAARAQRNQVITEAGDALKGLRDKWFGGGFWSSTVSQYDIYQILKDSLDIGLDATKNKYAEMVYDPGANQYLPNYSNISAALKDAGLDFYNLIDGWQDVVSARIQTLTAEFDTDFLENYSKQVSAYLYNNDIFSGLDEKTQSEIIALLNNVDKTFVGELAKNDESIFPWLQKAIIKPLSDSSTKKDISDAINDLMSLSDADTLDGIRKEIDRIGKILPEELTSALGSYLKSGDLDIDEWTQDLTVKFGSRLGKAISESFSLADIKVALSDAFDWDTLAPDNTLEKFNAELDRCKTKIEAVAASTKSAKITEAIDYFNASVQAANRLFAAQELSDDKIISDDVYDRLKDQNTELVATLERVDDELTGQHGWKIVDSDIEKYIEKQQSAAEETLRSNGAISEQYAMLQKYLGGTNSIEERISAYAEANSKLGDAYDKVANKEQFAYSEMISLKDTFPDLQFELDQTTGKYDLIGDSVVSLMKKNYEFIKSLQQQRLELLRLNAIDVFENSGWSESRAKQIVYSIVNQIDSNDLKSLQEYEDSISGSVKDRDISDFVERYTAALAEIEQAQADLDALSAKAPAGELKNKSKSSSSETEFSKNLKQLNMEKEALESEMELDPAFVKYNLSSMEDYYSKLANIAKAGYAAGEIDAVEYQGYVLDVFNGLREEVKKGYQKSFDTLSTEKKKFDEGMDWDKSLFATLRDYYINLGELAKKAYNDGAIDANEYQDYLIEVFKGLKEASVKEYDDMLSKLEDERQKYDAGMVWDRSVFTDLSDYYDKIEEINEKRFKENLSTTSEYVDELVKIFEGRNEMLAKTLSDYEHDIALMQNRDSVNSSGIPESEVEQIETYRMMQEMVHKAADTYREQMTGTMSDTEIEHSEYIKDMQTKWWEYENNIQSIQSEMFERSLSAYEDYISRRNKFGNWGADNEIAAWKRVDKFLDQSYENGIINYKTYLEKKLDVLESMYDAEKQRQQDFADAAVRIMEKELKALNKQKENYEKQKGNYESTVSAVVDLINDQIDKLKEESDELNKQLKLQKALKAVEEARSQRNIHIYRDNGTGFEWEADDKTVRQAQESYDELKREQDLNDQIDALEKYRDAWQATIDDYEKNADKQKAMALLGADWEAQILAMRTDKIAGFAQNYTNICDQLNEDVTGSIASQIKDLEDLKDEWSDAVDNIEYELGRYDELMDFEDEFRGAGLEQRKAMLEDFSQSGVQNLQNLIDKANELQNALDSLNGINTSDYGDAYPTIADDTAQKQQNVINEMKQNSAAWWFANESEQKTLSDRNKALGESLGWTRDANGIWWKKNGVRAYAEGGIADYTGVAMLHGTKSKPELVLNNADAGYLYSVLHGRQLVNPTSPSVQKAGETTVTIGDINLSGVNSPDTLAEAIVRQLPSRLIQRMGRK